MLAVCVYVHVKPENLEDFVRETVENARNTIQEPGNLRFDVIRQIDDPNRFVLYEVYRDEAGMAAHKDTPHYAKWRDAVAPWMAEPRRGVKHESVFPDTEEGWQTQL
ncbi:MAG: antibiotic biosynthesis monooxygenase [Candidatus Nealsonbacteria bacterium]|nr:antibiotic biosynthesis monooxygenase [Candidatus Nealsonbacteria bacterium]